MSRSIVFRRSARTEFDEAADWYEQRRTGLGVEFVEAVGLVLSRIASQPDLFASVSENVREALVPRFPYCIYYRTQPKRILVIAVFHTSRDPLVWQNWT